VEDVGVHDFDFHGRDVAGDGTWQPYTVLFRDLAQRGFGNSVPFSGEVDQLSWLIDPPDGQNLAFRLEVDQVALIADHEPQPFLWVSVDAAEGRPADVLTVDITGVNRGPKILADVYVGVLFPDGATLVLLTDQASLQAMVARVGGDPRTFQPIVRNVSIAERLSMSLKGFSFANLRALMAGSGGLPQGRYTFFAAVTQAGALDDGRIDQADIKALAVQSFTLNP
jgi:hypothetical protein